MLPLIRIMWPYHPDLLERAVPRYTSFPTAAEFQPMPGESALPDAIAGCDAEVSLYLHIPFCEQICWYCGCNTGAANKTQRLTAYLDALMHEVSVVAALLPDRCRVGRIAFGGGSPNAIAPIAFVRLLDRVVTSFSAHEPVISVELDPRGFTEEWAQVLGATGVSHVSLGVQTFESAIQERIGRLQPHQLIEHATGGLRRHGVRSINYDLMYGLPGQGMAELDATLAATIDLAPERIALFGYAHVPHILPRQRRIDASDLPDQALRFAMAAHGYETLLAAGYEPVGFDHFALPHDPMAMAARDGTLRRNFQGFTDDQAERLIGLGASAISIFPDRIIQNEKNAGRYRMRLSQDQLTGALGVWRSRDDRDRGMVIEDILCGRPTDLSQISGEWPLDGLAPFIGRGLVSLDGEALAPTDVTRPYARSIAALFDPYRAATPQRFSSAV